MLEQEKIANKIKLLKKLKLYLIDAINKDNQKEVIENAKRITELIISLKALYLSQMKKEQQKPYIEMYKQMIYLFESIKESIYRRDYQTATNLIDKLKA